MEWIALIIVAYFIFRNKAVPKTSDNVGNTGGTSTPNPTPTIPPFYQQDNAATASSPTTTLSFDKTGSNIKAINKVAPIYPIVALNPIPIQDISDTEQSSITQEKDASYANNGVGKLSTPIESPIVQSIGISNLVRAVTFDSPSSVPGSRLAPNTSDLARYHEDAATIAPNPPPNPKLETIIPKIAATIKTPVKVVQSGSFQRQSILREL